MFIKLEFDLCSHNNANKLICEVDGRVLCHERVEVAGKVRQTGLEAYAWG